jgi:hypothetical protein
MRRSRVLLALFAVYLAFIGGGPYYATIFPVRVLHHVVLTVVLALWLLARTRRDGLPRTPFDAPFLAATALWAVSAFAGLDARMAVEHLWLPFVHLLLFYVIAREMLAGRTRRLFELQFLLAALTVIIALAQYGSYWFGWGLTPETRVGWLSVLPISQPLVGPRLYLPLGVTTWLAAYCAPLIVLAFAWGRTARRGDERIALLALAAALLFVLVNTNSRGGLIAFGVAALLLAGFRLYAWMRRTNAALPPDVRAQRVRRQTALFAGAAALLVAGIAAAVLVIGRDPSRWSGDLLRVSLWRVGLQQAVDYPLGAGAGNYGRAIRELRPLAGENFDPRLGTAHNVVLNAITEVGWLAVLVLGWLALALLRAWLRQWRAAGDTPRRYRLEAALTALAGISAHSMVDTFTHTAMLLLVALLAAYCTLPEARPLLAAAAGTRLDRVRAGLALALVLGYGVFWFNSDRAQAAFNAGLRAPSPQQALAATEQAIALDPALRLYRIQRAYLLGQMADDDAALAAARTAYDAALALDPTWDTGWLNAGALAARAGDVPEALRLFELGGNLTGGSPPYPNAGALAFARYAEAYDAAPFDLILQRYVLELAFSGGVLPTAAFWSETDTRRDAVTTFAESANLEYAYRVARAREPAAAARLLPAQPATPAEWWLYGTHLLDEGRPSEALAALQTAYAGARGRGDYAVSVARALLAQQPPRFEEAGRYLDLAVLLGTLYEFPDAVRAEMARLRGDPITMVNAYRARAVPPRVIDQNYEGVLYGGRVASFELLPDIQRPGYGPNVVQPWYDLAAFYEQEGLMDAAANVYRAILAVSPSDRLAAARLPALTGAAP